MSRNKTVDKTTGNQFHGSDTASGEQGRVRRTKHAAYQLVPFPKAQREIAVALKFTEHKHTRDTATIGTKLGHLT
jgi:hypothetical protein